MDSKTIWAMQTHYQQPQGWSPRVLEARNILGSMTKFHVWMDGVGSDLTPNKKNRWAFAQGVSDHLCLERDMRQCFFTTISTCFQNSASIINLFLLYPHFLHRFSAQYTFCTNITNNCFNMCPNSCFLFEQFLIVGLPLGASWQAYSLRFHIDGTPFLSKLLTRNFWKDDTKSSNMRSQKDPRIQLFLNSIKTC